MHLYDYPADLELEAGQWNAVLEKHRYYKNVRTADATMKWKRRFFSFISIFKCVSKITVSDQL